MNCANPGFARVGQRALARQRHIERGTAGVGDDHQIAESLGCGIDIACYRRHRRAGLGHVDRPLDHVGHMHHAAYRRADQDLAAIASGAQILLKTAQMEPHHRRERGVDGGGGSPTIFAQDRIESVRKRNRQVRQPFGKQLAHAALMYGISYRPE